MKPIRVMTYNIRHALGMDREINLDRTCEVIAHEHPDVVFLNAVDRFLRRSGHVDQPTYLAEQLNMNFVFGRIRNSNGGEYGLAILGREPLQSRLHDLTNSDSSYGKRICMEAWFGNNHDQYNLLCTHMGIVKEETVQNTNTIRKIAETKEGKTILAGDFNGLPYRGFSRLLSQFNDIYAEGHSTFSNPEPTKRIDFIFASKDLQARPIIPSSPYVSVASDHRPSLADVYV